MTIRGNHQTNDISHMGKAFWGSTWNIDHPPNGLIPFALQPKAIQKLPFVRTLPPAGWLNQVSSLEADCFFATTSKSFSMGFLKFLRKDPWKEWNWKVALEVVGKQSQVRDWYRLRLWHFCASSKQRVLNRCKTEWPGCWLAGVRGQACVRD